MISENRLVATWGQRELWGIKLLWTLIIVLVHGCIHLEETKWMYAENGKFYYM